MRPAKTQITLSEETSDRWLSKYVQQSLWPHYADAQADLDTFQVVADL